MFDLHKIERHLHIYMRKCLKMESSDRSEVERFAPIGRMCSIGAKRDKRFAPIEHI